MALFEDIEREVYMLHEPTRQQRLRAFELDRHFEGLELGFVDSSVMAVAEDLGKRIATTDRRHVAVAAASLGITLLP